MGRLICVDVGRKEIKQVFSWRGSVYVVRHIFAKQPMHNIVGSSLEQPTLGASNEYPQFLA